MNTIAFHIASSMTFNIVHYNNVDNNGIVASSIEVQDANYYATGVDGIYFVVVLAVYNHVY